MLSISFTFDSMVLTFEYLHPELLLVYGMGRMLTEFVPPMTNLLILFIN